VQLARNGRFKIVTSAPLLEELLDVLTRPRLIRTRRLEIDEVNDFLTDVAHISTLTTINSAVAICRDPDDNAVLQTALAGHASYIVSRDGDLTRDLDLHEAATRLGLQLVTVAQFLQLLA
jgi:putative PIN family toxin of toxin-antitoxin system